FRHKPGIGGASLAQRSLGGQRESGSPPPGNPYRDHSHGNHGGHGHPGGTHHSRRRLLRQCPAEAGHRGGGFCRYRWTSSSSSPNHTQHHRIMTQENTMTANNPAYRAINPATGTVISEHPFSTDSEVDAAVAASTAAFAEWSTREIAD